MSSQSRYDAFVITAPGLEPLAVAELLALGAADARVAEGGATYSATPRSLYEANLHLRTATRIVIRVAEFGARSFHELERLARTVPWEAFIAPNLAVSLSVTCRKSRLYHSDAVAERVAGTIGSRVKGVRIGGGEGEADESETESQLVLVRFFRDRCTISIDSSGRLLHLRGYRQATAKAPMRETLAAATLLVSGWTGDAPLIDPMCGSGTIPIEGALIARRIAPGLGRGFAFERWPDFDGAAWQSVVDAARSAILPSSPVRILGSDRDAGAVQAASENATRATVANDIELSVRPISSIEPPADAGWLVSNAPYGVRVGERDRLRNLYAQLGKVIRTKCPGWQIALVTADPLLERQLRLPLTPVLRTSNGGIKVRVMGGESPSKRSSERAEEEAPDTAAAQRYPS
jgi:putative N6-adenine-specific DNA methylase